MRRSRSRIGLLLAVIACSACDLSGQDRGTAPAGQGPTESEPDSAAGGEAELTYVADMEQIPGILPGDFLLLPHRFAVIGRSGTVPVAGRRWTIAAAARKGVSFMGFDRDGDGRISKPELMVVQENDRILLELKLPRSEGAARNYAAVLAGLSLTTLNGQITSFSGTFRPGCFWKTEVNGQAIQIFDCDLDGRLTQEGLDGVAIGDSAMPIPLGKRHRIGGSWYHLRVDGEGEILGWRRLADVELGRLSLPEGDHPIAHAVVGNVKTGTFVDLARLGDKPLPAGSYTLIYGSVSKRQEVATFRPSLSGKASEVAAGERSEFKVGPPYRVACVASLTDRTLTIKADLYVVGAGGEILDLSITRADAGIDPPVVRIHDKEKVFLQQSMSYG